MQDVPPLTGHDLLILFLQLGVLLLAARALGEVSRRLHQPGVVGELIAGLLLGPTILGRFAPEAFSTLFPPGQLHAPLLEGVAWVGLVLLLLLTGLEVDVSRLRRIGGSALLLSAFGLVVPFAGGWALGLLLPDSYLVDPGRRSLFAAFMGTMMAVSALPVIARILMDLNLVRRNLGILTLSAAIVDDTAGWLILSIVAGIAGHQAFSAESLLLTLALLGAFLFLAFAVGGPVLRLLFRQIEERLADPIAGGTTVVVGVTLLIAATTEAIGVHAAFGAFVAGLLLRQVPRLPAETLETVERFVLAVLAPLFFAYVGLRADLGTLSGWIIPAIVLGVAVAGKIIGCELGGRLAGIAARERLAIGVAMTARGAMGLVVAVIGLSLGLLTAEIYAAVVMMAVLTSILASVSLGPLVRGIPLSEEERRRIGAGEQRGVFRKEAMKLLVPTAGGPHAETAFRLAAILGKQGASVTALHAETSLRRSAWLRRRLRSLVSSGAAFTPIEEHQKRLRDIAQRMGTRFQWKTAVAGTVSGAVLAEAARGYDAILIGASGTLAGLQDAVLREIVAQTSAHVVIVRGVAGSGGSGLRRLLVPTDGSFFARAALEFAVKLAEGSSSRISVFHVLPHSDEAAAGSRARDAVEGALLGPDRRPVTELTEVPVDVRLSHSDRTGEAIVHETATASYDLIVLGTENKALSRLLFYGQGTQYVLENAPCDVAVVIPRL